MDLWLTIVIIAIIMPNLYSKTIQNKVTLLHPHTKIFIVVFCFFVLKTITSPTADFDMDQ